MTGVTRREFMAGVVAGGCVRPGLAHDGKGRRLYRGNLHMHPVYRVAWTQPYAI